MHINKSLSVIKTNPFLSDSYKTIWLKHFKTKDSPSETFNYFSGLDFIKHDNRSVYLNVGETHTKGVSYAVLSEEDSALKNKTFLIYDVPTYFKVDTTQLGDQIKLLRSKQYPGFLIETHKYKSLNGYMLANFSKNSRNKNNKYKRRLEDSFNMSYRMFYGAITKEAYDFIFLQFRILLEKRFEDKQVTNNNLDEKEWSFYHDVAYQLILENKASLYVIYNNDKPIGVTLCYLSDDTLFDAITVFDIDYFKFHLGSVTIMKLIEWCIDNGFKNLDFSKGYFEYKTRWCTKAYDFEYHIFYDSRSLKSKMTAHAMKSLYDFKHYLREKKLNEKLHKITFKLKPKEKNHNEKLIYNFEKTELNEVTKANTPIDLELLENKAFKLMIFEFLYLYLENYNSIKLYKLNDAINRYLIEGKQNRVIATVNS
jgi:hypothetical protein